MERIGVRELRQNASKYLERVAAGETVEVTDRGRPVARLVPVREEGLQQLLLEGRATPATRSPAELLALQPLRPRKGQRLPSEILEEMRREDRR